MATDDFFRVRPDRMIELRHLLVVPAGRMSCGQIEAALVPAFARKSRSGHVMSGNDLFGTTLDIADADGSALGRPSLPLSLMTALLFLNHVFNLSDKELVARRLDNALWQYFSAQDYNTPTLPCDAIQIGGVQTASGAAEGELRKAAIGSVLQSQAVHPAEFERGVIDTVLREKGIAHPLDGRQPEIGRARAVQGTKRVGISSKQNLFREGRELRRKAGRSTHARRFKCVGRIVKCQRTVLCLVRYEIDRNQASASSESAGTIAHPNTLHEHVERIQRQQPKNGNEPYAMHAPQGECIGKGKARRPYEFAVKVSIAVTDMSALMVGAPSFADNSCDGRILSAQQEQTYLLLEDARRERREAVLDLEFRAVDRDNSRVETTRGGNYEALTGHQNFRLSGGLG